MLEMRHSRLVLTGASHGNPESEYQPVTPAHDRGHADASHRSTAAKLELKRLNPCTTNGERRGSCPGYVIDHIVPLCAGGPDEPKNMQWQTVEDAKRKDREEQRMCKAN